MREGNKIIKFRKNRKINRCHVWLQQSNFDRKFKANLTVDSRKLKGFLTFFKTTE